MEFNYQNQERYFKAKKRIEEIRGFYGNLAAYIAVNLGFLVLNLMTSPNELWFHWPMLGWGVGVIIHGMSVFNYFPVFGKEWEAKKIKEFMEQETRSKNNQE